MKAQTWLDQNYPKENRSKVYEIYINEQLEGELDLSDFTRYGVKVLISHMVDETKFEIKNRKGENAKIIKLINAQEYLNQQYPTKEEREKVTELNIGYKLERDLDLSDFVNLERLDCSNNKLTSLNISNCLQLKEISCWNNQLKEYWQDIHPEFDYSDKKEWEKQGFDKEQTKQWIEAGLHKSNYSFISWLKDNKKGGLEWVCNNKKEFKDLQERYKDYKLCEKCQQPNTGKEWCQPCNIQHWQQDLKELSSKQVVDKFIQEQGLDWVPYEQLTNIGHLADGGFGKVYKAQCEKYGTVALKSLNNSQNMTADFLAEIAKHKLLGSRWNIVSLNGISQDPITGNYLMIMAYMPNGNLRQYLKNRYSELDFRYKLQKICNVVSGLKDIHDEGLVHRDFHSGNILINSEYAYDTFITDFGLAKPANEENDKNIFGIIPYVAPEVLQGKPYTQASDIYSFGVVASEILTGLPPYFNRDYDTSLASAICQGLRPQFPIKIPQSLEDLINRCWDADPSQRPAAGELKEILSNWHGNKVTEFTQQIVEAETFNQTLPEEIRNPQYRLHPGAVMHSKLINTQQITQQLEKLKVIEEYHTKALEELTLDNFNLEKLTIEDLQAESSTQVQIEIPPKSGN